MIQNNDEGTMVGAKSWSLPTEKGRPKDFTWDELVQAARKASFTFEAADGGKTGGFAAALSNSLKNGADRSLCTKASSRQASSKCT